MDNDLLKKIIKFDDTFDIKESLPSIELDNEQSNILLKKIDFSKYIFDKSINSFIVKICNNKYCNFNIKNNDLLFVETYQEILDEKYVLVQMNNELSIKQFRNIDNINYLLTHNGVFLPLEIRPYINYEIIGVISKVIHNL